MWRSIALLALDRDEDALQAIDGIIAESLKRGFLLFLHVAEITRGQLLLQMGRLDDASVVLNGRFDPHGPPVVTVMDATGVVALGRLALHTGDGRQVRQTSEIAKAMLNESTPGVRRHAAWLLSLQATADGDPRQAHEWLCAMGEPERRHVLAGSGWIWPTSRRWCEWPSPSATASSPRAPSRTRTDGRSSPLEFRRLTRSRPTPAGCSTAIPTSCPRP